MLKVKDLIKELEKFPQDADCFAYEGEIIGVVINYGDKQGCIHCSESDDCDEKTKMLE